MPARFGSYEILYELKSGGMGAVLLGRRRGPGAFEQLVAIKTIRPEYASAPAVRAMFLDEAAILARLNHPGIATVHDFGEDGGALYMVMEYVAGIALRDLRDVPPIVTARAIAEAARGLHAAHEARDNAGHPLGLVHRDISPDNLMLGYDGHVKVIDFGIALVKNRQSPVTEFGTVKGKPPYMSPEQVKNEAMDRRSDVFSLGVVTWELLTGQPLFEGDSIYAIAIAVEQQPILPPSRVIGAPLPAGLDAAVMAALARDPEQRTPTAAAFAEALDGVVQASASESLAAWAARELEGKRSEHRAWLAKIVTGSTPRAAGGRESGQHTEVGQVGAPIADPVVVKAPGGPVDPIADTSFGGADVTPMPRKKKLAPLALVLAAVLLAAVALWLVLGGGSGKQAGATRDAAIAIAVAPDAAAKPIPITPLPDAASAVAVVVVPSDADIAVAPIDAPRHAGWHHHDGSAAVAHDAAIAVAVAPPPVGEGVIDIKAKADASAYANVVIDGSLAGVTPLFKRKIAAGHHVIRFLDPASGSAIDTQAIDVVDGQHLTITER